MRLTQRGDSLCGTSSANLHQTAGWKNVLKKRKKKKRNQFITGQNIKRRDAGKLKVTTKKKTAKIGRG